MIMPALRESRWDASRGKKSWAPVELLDLFPTITDLVGLPAKYGPKMGAYQWQGLSLRPILENTQSGYVKAYAQSQFPRGSGSSRKNGYTLRTTRYRLTMWCPVPFTISMGKCYFELYDFLADPGETTNIAYTNVQVRNEMLKAWNTNSTYNMPAVRPWDLDERVQLENIRQPFP